MFVHGYNQILLIFCHSGLIGSPYHPAPSGFGYNGKSAAKYGEIDQTQQKGA